MSYNIELELQRFPKTVTLKDGNKATVATVASGR